MSNSDFDFDDEAFLEFLRRRREPMKLLPRSGIWLSARRAKQIVIEQCELSEADAIHTICQRILHWVPAKVLTISRMEKRHDYVNDGKYSSLPRGDFSHFSEGPSGYAWEEVMQMFGCISGENESYEGSDGDYARWETGDFRITIPKDFSDVRIEITGLSLDRGAFLESVGLEVSAQVPSAKLDEDTLTSWIRNCQTENSKVAWAMLRTEFGSAAPKRDEVFLPSWKRIKGARRPGRIKSPS